MWRDGFSVVTVSHRDVLAIQHFSTVFWLLPIRLSRELARNQSCQIVIVSCRRPMRRRIPISVIFHYMIPGIPTYRMFPCRSVISRQRRVSNTSNSDQYHDKTSPHASLPVSPVTDSLLLLLSSSSYTSRRLYDSSVTGRVYAIAAARILTRYAHWSSRAIYVMCATDVVQNTKITWEIVLRCAHCSLPRFS